MCKEGDGIQRPARGGCVLLWDTLVGVVMVEGDVVLCHYGEGVRGLRPGVWSRGMYVGELRCVVKRWWAGRSGDEWSGRFELARDESILWWKQAVRGIMVGGGIHL